ncbi:hypothetical protein H4Q26_010651 [Puccinia striiformis f. sp. tritici PST-130]|nr:hypothetical protein H4Q26_010651 [Puccinia striiformis f. sp. tritici PST-130]
MELNADSGISPSLPEELLSAIQVFKDDHPSATLMSWVLIFAYLQDMLDKQKKASQNPVLLIERPLHQSQAGKYDDLALNILQDLSNMVKKSMQQGGKRIDEDDEERQLESEVGKEKPTLTSAEAAKNTSLRRSTRATSKTPAETSVGKEPKKTTKKRKRAGIVRFEAGRVRYNKRIVRSNP